MVDIATESLKGEVKIPSKERERSGLLAVYGEDEFDITSGENPDFVLARLSIEFGVEVTEVFESQSMARARTHPSYISELLAGGKTMHPADSTEFSIISATITDADGHIKHESVPGIMRPTPPINRHVDLIGHAIARKEARFHDYITDLHHVNLVLVDDLDSAWSISEELDTGALIQPKLRDPLRRTSFREIYLVTRTRSRGGIFVPMRMLFLVGEFYGFVSALDSFDLHEDLDVSDVIPQFARYELDAGAQVVLGRENGEVQVGLGNVSIAFRPGQSLPIFDHADQDMRLDLIPIPPAVEPSGRFAAHFADIWQSSRFISEICRPVRKMPFWWPRPAGEAAEDSGSGQ